jgi:hypothetical protein
MAPKKRATRARWADMRSRVGQSRKERAGRKSARRGVNMRRRVWSMRGRSGWGSCRCGSSSSLAKEALGEEEEEEEEEEEASRKRRSERRSRPMMLPAMWPAQVRMSIWA